MNEVFNCVEDLFSKELLCSDFLSFSLIAFRTDPLKDVVAIVVGAVVVVVVGVVVGVVVVGVVGGGVVVAVAVVVVIFAAVT